MNETAKRNLITAARTAGRHAHANYSNFPVGAALETTDGEIITGCNVESSSYGLTICAEQVALAKALSEGKYSFKTIAIVGPNPDFCPPCGACRQLLYDYAPDLSVIMTDGQNTKTVKLSELLPFAFGATKLKRKRK